MGSGSATVSLLNLAEPGADQPPALIRNIEDAWPERAAPRPRFRIDRPARSAPSADLTLILPGDDLASLFKLVDRIDDLRKTIAVIADPDRLSQLARLGAGVVSLPADFSPRELAIALSALILRHRGTTALLHEHDALRRSQSGLEREMTQIREELQLAARVQREFMPKRLPECPGVEIAALFRPCGYVSGDIYDIVRLDETHVGFFIADAVGHGVPAALMTMVLSHGMSMKEITGGEYRIVPPAEVLQGCNDALIAGNLPSDRFLTAAYGVLDTATMRVRFAGAGHPPPMIVGPERSRAIETDGPLLGVFPGVEFQEVEFTLAGNEALILYSDGFETAFPDAPDAGESGFSRRLPTTHYLDHFSRLCESRAASGSLREAFLELAARVDAHSGSLHQVDDITAIAIARDQTAPAASAPAVSAA